MKIVTSNDFLLIPYKIPELTGAESAAFTFDKWAEECVEEILRDVLGHNMYEDFEAGMAVTPVEDIEERWSKLMDGESFEYSSKPYKWRGMKDLLIPYVFCMWTRHNVKQRGRNGYFTPKVENAEATDGMYEMVSAYNAFARKVGSGCRYNGTLYGYLKTKTTPLTTSPLFTNWCWKDPGFMNEFNL